MVGIGENAGVVDIGDGYAVTFKVESHNHPSYVEPYQGAATGVGGIVRDILSMGARPVAVMDPLRFGPLDADDTHRVLPGIVAGIGGYGNCLGLPNIGGEAVFDPSYVGNPLVNALCVGVMRHEQIHLAKATGAGNQVILYGAKTGGDGIGGVSVLASETFSDGGPTKRPSVQVGDPFMEKLLIECTLELFAEGARRRHPGPRRRRPVVRDVGAGQRRRRWHARLARPGAAARRLARSRRDPDERVAGTDDGRRRAGHVERFLAICEKWDVDATVVGEVTEVTEEATRPAGHRVARRDDRRRTTADGRARGTGLPAAVRPAGVAGRAAGRRLAVARPTEVRGRAARDLARAGRLAEPVRQVVDHRPVRPLRAGQHRARPARGRRHRPGRRGVRSRRCASRPTATAGSPSSTRTPARSSRWPRPTATSPPRAPGRWRSPTASTSARRRTRT